MTAVITPTLLICDRCGHAALVKFVPGKSPGAPQVLPQLSRRDDGTYVAIACPNCGEREQWIAAPGEPVE
jgi:hypothetical protein